MPDLRKLRAALHGVCAVAITGGVLWAGNAQAQDLSATGSTFGAPERPLTVRAATDVTYDSNVARANTEGARLRDIRPEDFKFSPSLSVNVAKPAGPAVLSIDGLFGYDFYARNSRLNRERINVTGGATSRLAICDVGVTGGYLRQQSDLVDLSIDPGDPTASSVNVQSRYNVGGSVACGAEVGFRPTAFVEYRTTDNSAEQRRVSDSNVLSYGGGVTYSNPAFGQLTAFAGRSDFTYPHRTGELIAQGIVSDFHTTYGGLRLDRRLGARLQVNGQITYVDMNTPSPGVKPFSGINWQVAASLRVGSRARVSLSTAHTIDASNGYAANYAKESVTTLDIEYALTARLNLTLSGSHRSRDFLEAVDVVGVTSPNDKIDRVSARMAFKQSLHWTFSLAASYENRNSRNNVYDYDSVRGLFSVAYSL